MSDTYNPNEIAKVKHLNEVAQLLCRKIDGTITLLPIVPSSFTIDKNDGGSWSYPPIPADGVVSLPLSTVPRDSNRGIFRVYWTCDFYSAPLISDIVDSDTNNPFMFTGLSFTNRWTLTIRTNEAITEPRTVKFKFYVRGDETHDDFVRNVTINITEG